MHYSYIYNIVTQISHSLELLTWAMKASADHFHFKDQILFMETRESICYYWDCSWCCHAGLLPERIKKTHSEQRPKQQTDMQFMMLTVTTDIHQSGLSEQPRLINECNLLQFI